MVYIDNFTTTMDHNDKGSQFQRPQHIHQMKYNQNDYKKKCCITMTNRAISCNEIGMQEEWNYVDTDNNNYNNV